MRAVGLAGVALVSSLAVASFARGDDAAPGSSRIVIRGTGRDVVVERVPIPSPRFEAERGALAQAARLAAAGADDREVLGYLRAHREEIPAILDASDVGRLRKAGAGDSVVAYLASVSAFDVDGLVGIDYGVYGVPETFVIDKQGVIRYKQIGPITPEALEQKILPLIRKLDA